MQVTVKISADTISYKDKKDGSDKTMDCIKLEFPNGSSMNIVSSRFNYRVYDYLVDTLSK